VIRQLKSILHRWRLFLDCCPATEDLSPDEWSPGDAEHLQAFLKTGTGQRWLACLRISLRQREAEACNKPVCADFERGRASGWRSALAFTQSLSEPPPAPQSTGESEFVLPGAQHRFADRMTP